MGPGTFTLLSTTRQFFQGRNSTLFLTVWMTCTGAHRWTSWHVIFDSSGCRVCELRFQPRVRTAGRRRRPRSTTRRKIKTHKLLSTAFRTIRYVFEISNPNFWRENHRVTSSPDLFLEHHNFVGSDEILGPIVISMQSNNCIPFDQKNLKIIMRTKKVWRVKMTCVKKWQCDMSKSHSVTCVEM